MRNSIYSINVDAIAQQENSRQIYSDQEMSELMISLKQHGLMQPMALPETATGNLTSFLGTGA